MRLYSGSSLQFIEDTVHNQIAEKLKSSFFTYFRYYPSPAEVTSWRNSLRAISQVFQYANLLDHGIILEYQLPMTSKRFDCMICGKDENKVDNAIIIELKQWDKCEESECENEVLTWVGGAKREVLHPSIQVGQYQQYLSDTHTAFYETKKPIILSSCTYLHNYAYNSNDVLFSKKFSVTLEKYPLFTGDDFDRLKSYLVSKLIIGDGLGILKRVEDSKFRPSKKLMEHVSNIISGNSEFILLDEQLVVYDKVLSCAKNGFRDKQKAVIIVKGGPGTGKSVIAINLMADLLSKGFNAQYATGSKAFTETLRKKIGPRGGVQFKYFNSYSAAEENAVDILISDEAHRIRETSNGMYTPKHLRTNTPQIKEILKAAKVSVFFIDDDQIVRPNEIGSSNYIKRFAEENNSKVYEYELEAQFRCNGSDAFVNWVNNTLGIKKTANVIWDLHEEFDFKILNSPKELYEAIKKKNSEVHNSARMVAGFCWKWSDTNKDGTLNEDVVIDDFKMTWEAKNESTFLAPGIPKAALWAYDPNGVNQCGSIYTIQGFEFDYVGVIIGKDLRYNFDNQEWEGHPESSADAMVKRAKADFVKYVKNVYRVLFSRGMKGCYVYFMDKDTERFFKSRIELKKR
ncbi:DUF2075 domain-containing protein [archaeon]|nr:DUF2075 domain-containing protein [archaeon]